MKFDLSVVGFLALAAPALAAPTPVEARAAADYGTYGDYPPPPGGYGDYGSYGTVDVPKPVPVPASYNDYPKPDGGYGTYATYGAYKRALDYVKSLF